MRKLLLFLALALALPANIFAQGPNQNYEQETQAPARAHKTQSQAATAEEASKLEASEADMAITYEQIMANPDDVELNYRYARAQIARGELKSAAATLERVLLVKPDLARVRLLYAIVLLRLDNLVEAEQELETLKALPMPESLRREILQYLSLIKKSRKRSHLTGTLGIGWEDDDNRNSTPASDRMLFGDTPVTLTGTSGMRHNDASLLFIGNVGFKHDLGYQEGHTLQADYSYYRAEQASVKSLNLQAHSVSGGGTYKNSIVNVTPKGYFDHILLDQSSRLTQTTFLREWGFGVHFDHAPSRYWNFYMDFKDLVQQYQPTFVVRTAPERDGADMNFVWGADVVLNPRMKLGVATGYEIKNANKEYYSYTRNSLSISHQWLLPRGTFLLSNAYGALDVYDQPQTALSIKYRRDKWFRLGATYGVPMTLVHPVLKDLLFTVGYEFFDSFSNLENYSYTNNKFVGMMTYRWDAAF